MKLEQASPTKWLLGRLDWPVEWGSARAREGLIPTPFLAVSHPTQVKASAPLPHSPAPRRVRFDPSSSTGDLRQGPAKSAYQWQVRPAPSGVRPQWRPPTTYLTRVLSPPLTAARRSAAGAKPRGGGGGGGGAGRRSAWLAADGSKRWGEAFFLLYTPFWLTLCLGIVVPFKLYEVLLLLIDLKQRSWLVTRSWFVGQLLDRISWISDVEWVRVSGS